MSSESPNPSTPHPLTISCLVADDHPAVLDAVIRYLADDDEIDVVGQARTGEQALRMISELKPLVGLLDIRMPGKTGIEVARGLAERQIATGIILYTADADRGQLIDALDVGVRGYLLKEAPLSDLSRAIRVIAAGETYIDPALAGKLPGPHSVEKLPQLTKREREILRLIADGMRNEQIARELSISPFTVRTHVKNVMEKLGAETRTQAVATALRRSLIT